MTLLVVFLRKVVKYYFCDYFRKKIMVNYKMRVILPDNQKCISQEQEHVV